MDNNILLTGDRPTGLLHLGHYVGTIANRVKLHKQYKSYFLVADLHMLTTKNDKENIAQIYKNAKLMVLDAISAGIDYKVSNFYLQSAIPEIYEIYTLLQSLITVPRLSRLPSLKDMVKNADMEEMPFALLGYPILQAADILCVKSNFVPVGKDNFAHVEITRELARRFNSTYAEIFPIPEIVETETPSLIGICGKAKMSKSLNNAIFLSDNAENVTKKVKKMFTDPNRLTADTPGNVINNPVFIYHDIFNPDKEEVLDLKTRYKQGKVGDSEVKQKLSIAINNFLDPIRERREKILNQKGLLDSIIYEGTKNTREIVKKTVYDMRKAMGINKTWQKITNATKK